MIALPLRSSDAGVEARILLAECRSPASATYTIGLANECMQLMHAVLWNRMKDPAPFLAKGAKSLADIVRAKGQFAGFENYPRYNINIQNRIQAALDIANSSKDPRNTSYADYVNKAIKIANSGKATVTDPSPGKLVAWRTANSGSPSKNLTFYKTVLGVDFYYQ